MIDETTSHFLFVQIRHLRLMAQVQIYMCFTIQNLKVHGSSDSDYVNYLAELHSPSGEIIRVILSPNEQGIIAYNVQTEKMYPIVGVVEQKTLSELKDNDMIVLGECIEESK